jgi:hypothetical protein
MAAFGLSADCGTRPPHNLCGITLKYVFSGSTTLVDLGLLIVQVSRSLSVRILWTSDQPVAETYT